MISYQTILQQLQKQVEEAKNASNEQQIREALSAVRALCDVVLLQSVDAVNSEPAPIAKFMTPMPTQQAVYTAKIDEEDGANGESLFDF